MNSLLGFLVVLLTFSPVLHAETHQQLIARVLKAADKNHDGKLSLGEYLPLDVQAKHHGEAHFESGDANLDGFLDVIELAETLKKQTWFAILSEGTDACFARLDANKDGKLDATEYRKISRMGAHAGQHFSSADTDKDGFLSLAEFAAHAEAKLNAVAQPPKRYQ